MTETTHTPEDAMSTIMDALRFDADDLQANREGHLSERQVARIRQRRRRDALIGTAMIPAFVLLTTTFLFFGLRQGSLLLSGIATILLVCNTMLMLMFARNWLRQTADLKAGHVEAVTGAAQHVARQYGPSVVYSVRVADAAEVATVTAEAFKAFQPGEAYTLYRTGHTGTVLTVEPND